MCITISIAFFVPYIFLDALKRDIINSNRGPEGNVALEVSMSSIGAFICGWWICNVSASNFCLCVDDWH